MRDTVYTDAARFKQLSILILDANRGPFPSRSRIEQLAERDSGLRAWIRNYSAKSQFMSELKIFFYRERNRRRLTPARQT